MENELKSRIIAWVTDVFSSREFNKIDVEFPEYDASGGYGSEMVMVNVTGKIDKNKTKEIFSLIVKRSMDGIIKQDNLNMRVFYENENNLYSKMVPYLRNFAIQRNVKPFEYLPYCYGTIRRDNQYVIVMENLKSKGYKLNDIKKPLDFSHTKLILEAYAEWHALSFALRDQEPNIFEEFSVCNCSKKSVEAKAYVYMIATIEKELLFLMDLYKTRGLQLVADKLETLKINFGKIIIDGMMYKDEDYVVIRHGDCWNNNYLFHYDESNAEPDNVAIIDWQVAVIGSPMLDVAHFLFYCCPRKVLDLLDDLLILYYNSVSRKLRELGSNPKKCFPWKHCIESFNKYAPIGIAGLPMVAKLRSRVDIAETYNIANVERDGNYNSIFNGKLKDPEEYFKIVNEILEFCIERNFI